MDQTSLHNYILEQVTDHPDLENMQDSEKLYYLFSNYRHRTGKHVGLRLSYHGDRIVSKIFEPFRFEHDLGYVDTSIILKLDKNMIYPYYISKKFIVFYSHSEAAWFRLQGSDLKLFAECL